MDGLARGLLPWARMVIVEGEEYLTVDEASQLMGVKTATIYAYVSRGILQSYRQGMRRQRLYRRAEVEALTRVAPTAREHGGGRKLPEIPLAESWIRH